MFNYEVHSHDTRDKKIYNYQVKQAFAKKCLRHSLPLLLNNLPEIVKQKLISHSTQGFARYVKMYCSIQNCMYICKLRIKNHLYNVMLYVYLKQCLTQRWSNRTRVLVLVLVLEYEYFLSTRTRVRSKVIVLVLEYITKVIVLTITSHDYIFFHVNSCKQIY